MKRITIGTALAISLLAGTSAFAQHEDHGRGGGDGGGRSAAPPSQAAPSRAAPSAPVNRAPATPERSFGGGPRGRFNAGSPEVRAPQNGGPHFGYAPGGQGGLTPQFQGRDHSERGDRGGGGQVFDRHDFEARGDDPRDGRRDFRGDGGPRRDFGSEGDNGGHDWRADREDGRPRYDEHAFPRSFRPEHPYRWRGEEWREPHGFYYRRWGYGDRLPWGWIGPQWFVDDYYDYDLPVPPWGFEWIRVGPDALLIDLATGMVVEAAYGLFY